MKLDGKTYEVEPDLYTEIQEGQSPSWTIDTKINSIIANTKDRSEQLTRIEKHFIGHMIRQIGLELEIQKTLEEISNGYGQRNRPD